MHRLPLWPTTRVAALLAAVAWATWMVAAALVYAVLAALGVLSTVTHLFGQLGSASGQGALVTAQEYFVVTALTGLAGTVLLAGMSVIVVACYNLCARLVGGLQIRLTEP